MRDVRLVKFHKQKGVSLATLNFNIKKNNTNTVVTRNIATRCKSEEDFKKRLSNTNYCDGVIIVGLMDTKEGIKIPLIKEFKELVGDYIWTFPAGQVEDNEDLRITAIRELKEETGLEIVSDDIYVSKPIYTSVGITDQKTSLAVLKCKGTPSTKYLTPGEDIKIELLSLNQIKELLRSDEEIAGNTKLMLSLIISTDGNIDKLKELL